MYSFGIKILLFGLVVILSSCVFNEQFYAPTKIPATVKRMKMYNRDTKDSTYVFLDENHQPTFKTPAGELKELNYIIESYNFKSISGNKLNGWLLKPRDQKPIANILFLHGNGGCIPTHFMGLVPLVEKGFQVFVFDYSGYGFSDGKPTRKNVLQDANSALDFVKTIPSFSNGKLIVYGQSLGGHLAAVIAAQNQNKLDALVIEGAFSSHKDVAVEMTAGIARPLIKEVYAAKEIIKSYKKPLLVIHSSEDQTIAIKLGKRIYDNANQPKEFYEIKGPHIAAPILYTDSIKEKIMRMVR